MSPTEIEALRAFIRDFQGGDTSGSDAADRAFSLRTCLETHRAAISDFIAAAGHSDSHTTH